MASWKRIKRQIGHCVHRRKTDRAPKPCKGREGTQTGCCIPIDRRVVFYNSLSRPCGIGTIGNRGIDMSENCISMRTPMCLCFYVVKIEIVVGTLETEVSQLQEFCCSQKEKVCPRGSIACTAENQKKQSQKSPNPPACTACTAWIAIYNLCCLPEGRLLGTALYRFTRKAGPVGC